MSISLKINDIIGINLKDNAHIIEYIDDTNIKLVNATEILHYDIIDGFLNTTSIQTIYLLSRSTYGYAEEHGFIKDKWIEFMIGDITLFGQITNTEYDMIEIKVFPGSEEIYIDFAYKGLPSYIQYIKLREQPTTLDSDEIEIEYGDQYMEYIELPDHLKRYGIDSQTHDLLNDILSTIPTNKRNTRTMNRINTIINRFTTLRSKYSNYNDRHEIDTYKIYGHDYRPLKEYILNNNYVDWLVPIVNIEKPLYDEDDLDMITTYTNIQNEFSLNYKLENHQKLLFYQLNELFTSYEPIINNESIYYKEVNNDVFGLTRIEVYNKKGTRSNYPYLQMFNTGLTMLKNKDIVPLTSADVISIIKYRKLPKYFIDFYRLKLPTTHLIERSYYNHYSNQYWNDFNPYKKKLTNYNDKPSTDYNDYLHTVIDSTIDLLEKIKPSYTIDDIVYQLEPYLIYKEHLNIEHYNYIHKKIKKNISNYKNNFNKLTDQFISLYNAYDHLKSKPNSLIFDIIKRSEHNYVEKLSQFYKLDPIYSSTEHLYNILAFDGGKTYMTILSNMNLYSSHDIEHILKQVLHNTDKDKKDNCNKLNEIYKKIVKHYTSLEDLMKDNHKPVIINPSSRPELYNMIINKLYESDPTIDSREIDDILDQEKESLPDYVANGHYAILDNGNETTYYKRTQDKWVKIQIQNENTCEVKEKCIMNNNECKSDENIKFQLKHELVDHMLKEYKNLNDVEYKTQTKKLLLKLKYHIEKLPYLKMYHLKQKLKYNNQYQYIASKLENIDIELSPYEPILYKIMAIEDITVKYQYIIKFTNNYTREAHNNENEYWYYCIKTGVKLMPSFLFKLATVYEQERDQYYIELEHICSQQGIRSDDGDKVVDKHSGFMIKLIEYDTEEGYDKKGFKIKTREIILEDDKEIKHSISNVEHFIINTLTSLAKNIGITMDKNTLEELTSNIKMYNFTNLSTTLIYIIFSYFFMHVQLNNIKPVKTFPNCVMSFDGYPIPDNDDLSGLKYMACVMKSMHDHSQIGSNITKIINNFKTTIQNIFKVDIVLDIKYKNFIKIEHKEDRKFYDIHWDLFLPPLKNIELKFKPPSQSDIDKMTNYEIKSVMMYFSFLIIQDIQTVMNKFEPLLMTTSLNPYTVNTCCNEEDKVIYQFFKKNNKEISILNDKVFELSSLIKNNVACYLTNNENKLHVPIDVPKIFLEKTMYRTFIEVCKLNQKTLLVDTDLLQFCPSFKFDESLSSNEIDAQIKLLKEKNVIYTEDAFKQLLNIMNYRNIIKTVNLFYHLNDIQDVFDILMIQSININQIGTLSNQYQSKIQEYFSTASLKTSQKNDIKKFFEQRKIYNSTTTINELYVLANFIQMISHVIPYMIVNNVEYKELMVPWKRLNLSERHGKDLMEDIQKYYHSIMNLKNEYDIMEYMTLMVPILEKNYINLSNIEWQSHKNISRVFNLYIDHIFMLYIRVDKENIYNRLIVNVLYAFIENFNRETHYTNITEEVIQEKIEIIERDEKNEMTTRLKNMNETQRRLSNVKQELKLGEWSVGLTKSLWKYDKDAYDEMRDKEMKKMIEDKNLEMLREDVDDVEIASSKIGYFIEDEMEAVSEEYRDEMEY